MKRRYKVFMQIIFITFSSIFFGNGASPQSLTQLNSAGSYIWNATDAPKIFNDKLQISFVRGDMGFPSYGTVLAGGGYSNSQDGAVFQIYFPYSTTFGGNAPKVRVGQYNNQGWSSWATFYTSANANLATIDWTTRNLIAYGNVLIGKTSQANTSYKLDVNGNIRANKVVVNATGADYVFDSAYQLSPMDSLNKYISRFHHLPGIPSAEQIKKDGLSVGSAYTKLLEKMEEMTRYMICQNEIIKKQNLKIDLLNDRLDSVMKKLKYITNN